MENKNFLPVRKLSFQKKKRKINSSKNNRKVNTLITGKKIIEEEVESRQLSSQVKKRKKAKFNSIDNIIFLNNINPNNNMYLNKETSSPRKPKKILKKGNYFEEYLEKLYEDEPHLKKSVFKKSNNKINTKNFKRKVSFLSPGKNKNTQNIKTFKINMNNMNKSIINLENNESKNKIIKNEEGDEQSYGYNKKYNVNILNKSKNDDDIIKTSIFNKDFDKRALKRKQTNKTSVNFKIRNFDKRSTCKTINNLRNTKKKNSSKSMEKKFKKKISKIIKDKEIINNKEQDKNNIKNINNNNNINNDDKILIDKNKQKKYINSKSDKNDKKNLEKNNKKNQDLSLKKSIENAETLVQIEEKNKKKKKKPFCCPFLICLKMNNNEENENFL